MVNKINQLLSWALVGFTGTTGALLLVNAVRAMAGTEALAIWHWVTLAILVHLCRKAVSRVTIARAAVRMRRTRKRAERAASRAILGSLRAVHGLAAHFLNKMEEAR